MITFQEVILRLQEYWNRQGCALLQPIDLEVGAGTSHTATVLRLMFIPRVVRWTAVTAKIPIVCSSTISIKWF